MAKPVSISIDASQFTMKRVVFLFVVSVVAYVQSAPSDSETVWLKDLTARFQTDKRTLSDLGLADELTFHLMRGSHALTLNLKRNDGIDPNADVYVVRKLKDGRSHLEKIQHLEQEDVAYYQDMENGAFMTVRCVKRSNGQCDRVINGNIRIGDRNYDLQPEETDVASRNLLEVLGLLGKRYVLHDQANIQRELSFENKDAANVNETNVELELVDLLRRFPQGQAKRNHFPRADAMLSSRNVTGLYNRETTVKRNNLQQVYYVEITVLIDSGIWDLFSSQVSKSNDEPKEIKVKKSIRRAFSHVINGVNLRYKEIEDTSIAISVALRQFVIFEREADFPHKDSKVITVNGKTYVDLKNYLNDILEWDIFTGWELPDYDHAMLFTRHDLYEGSPSNNAVRGLCWTKRVCEMGSRTSVVEVGDYFLSVGTATHELGHNLGATHDGTSDAKDCKSGDNFIMTEDPPTFDPAKPYSRNPWLFSKCSVEAFKKTLKDKKCVENKGVIYNEVEWTKFMMKLPGEKYTINEQCQLIMGKKSVNCGTDIGDVCLFMKCTDPKTEKCLPKYFSAARGTICGRNKVQTVVSHWSKYEIGKSTGLQIWMTAYEN